MTLDDWKREGYEIASRHERMLGWALGYWLVSGRAWDRDFAISAEITGYSRSHLWNLYRVAVAFPKGKAHPDLSIAVHRELLREPNEAQRLIVLSQAIEERWTQADAVAYFEAHPPSARPLVGDDEPPSRTNKAPYQRKAYVGAHVQCPHCLHLSPETLDAAADAGKRLWDALRRSAPCMTCHGLGRLTPARVEAHGPCPDCNGTGKAFAPGEEGGR